MHNIIIQKQEKQQINLWQGLDLYCQRFIKKWIAYVLSNELPTFY